MVVLMDVERREIHLYKEDGLVVIPFVKAQELFQHVNRDTVYYVTNAMEINVSDIISLIRDQGVEIKNNVADLPLNKYLHTVNEGTIRINDSLKFEGKFDLKPYTLELENIVKENEILQSLLQQNKIEIIGEARRRSLMQEFKKTLKQQKEIQNQVDKRLDKIILTTKVKDFDGVIDTESVPEMDITGDMQSENFMTEEEKIMKQLNIKRK